MAVVANACVDAHEAGVADSATRLCTLWVMVLGRGSLCLRSLSVLGAACARRGLGKCVYRLTRRGRVPEAGRRLGEPSLSPGAGAERHRASEKRGQAC